MTDIPVEVILDSFDEFCNTKVRMSGSHKHYHLSQEYPQIQDIRELLEYKQELVDLADQRRKCSNDPHHKNIFGMESVHHIQHAFVSKYWESPQTCVMKVVQDIYFNDKFPENNTVMFTPHNNEVRVHRGSLNWAVKDKRTVFRRMLEKACDMIEAIGTEQNSMMPEECTHYLEAFYNDHDTTLKNLMEQVESFLVVRHHHMTVVNK